MSYNYVVTAYKPTAVMLALTGNFTGPHDLNLIQCKGNCLVVNLVTPEGLKVVVDVNVYGRITLMQLFRPKGYSQDLLFFMTARYHLAVVSYNATTGEFVSRAFGDVKDRASRPTEGRQIGLVDPSCNVIGLHLYAGLFKVVPLELDSGQPLTAFNIRLDDLIAIDLQFLHGFDVPTIAYIAQESSGRVLRSNTISVADKELVAGPWNQMSLESQASLLYAVPLPMGGVLAVGYETVAYYNLDVQLAIDPPMIKESIISCFGAVDNKRFMLGDACGRLLMLFLDVEEKMDSEVSKVTALRLEVLGDCSGPSCLAYLDNGVVFVGSNKGDSQLVKLSATAESGSGHVQVMETFTNIGPIVDMVVVDLDKQGQDVIISCSGVGRSGSLRIIRSGIGINELASIDIAGVKGIWSLHTGPGSDLLHNTLVLSFVGQTTVLSLRGEEVEEEDLAGLAADQQTFHCGNVAGGRIVQVTPQAVRLINKETMELVCKWHPPSGRNISTVSCNSSQCVVAVGSELHYLEIKAAAIQEISHAVMEYEVACVDVTPLAEGRDQADLCAVGLWTDVSVRLLQLPSLTPVHTQLLGGDIIPRSVLMVSFTGVHYLLCALGDGCLMYYQLDPDSGQLSNGKKVVLGTKPIVLKQFRSSDSINVFACSNHPTIIHCSNQKLLFSNVNLKEVSYLCSLNSEAFKDSLALVDDTTLTIGAVDQIQMLHIQTVPLGETPRRISHQPSSQTFAVPTWRIEMAVKDRPGKTAPLRPSASTTLPNVTVSSVPDTVSSTVPDGTEEVEVFTVLLIDESSFDILHGFQLCPCEHAMSICSCLLGGEQRNTGDYYVVGTAFVLPAEREPNHGRILVFQVMENRTLQLVYERMEPGSVYQVKPFSNGKLITSVNSKDLINYVTGVKQLFFGVTQKNVYSRSLSQNIVYEWTEDSELKEVTSFHNNILALYLCTKGDFVLVGDLMRSFKLLVYKEGEGLEEIGLDTNLNPAYLTAVEMIDDENYIGADGRHLFICQKNSEATVEADLPYMQQPARIYIGDNVNVFGRGSLVMNHPGSSPSPIQGKPLLYGTVHGAIGLIGQLSRDNFTLLMKLQNRMSSIVRSLGNIEHEVYRSFSTEHVTKMPEGFIDGDLVERFLDLPRAQTEEICRGLKTTDATQGEVDVQVEDMLKVVEDLSRLH